MLEITNVKVYDLEESIISCRNAMRLTPSDYSKEDFEKSLDRAKKLTRASYKDDNVHCHDNFMTGIRVSFDMKYTQYITKQFQRYHWFDYVSSSSLMHKITKMDFDECCNKYVKQESKDLMKRLIAEYNGIEFALSSVTTDNERIQLSNSLYRKYMEIISNCPMGTELFVRVSTNYKQLQTIYWQRKHHKLKEDWGEFCKFVESLPYANELILGKEG